MKRARTELPLNAIRVFESVARLGSFTQAAQELFVTPGAVSKQIKHLETFLEVKLFQRLHEGLELTEAGKHLQPAAQSALDTLDAAIEYVTRPRSGHRTLTLNVLPSLSTQWLIPRLRMFRQLHADIGINVVTGDGAIDFVSTPSDLAIRVAREPFASPPNCVVRRFMSEVLVPVCSPQLLTSGPSLRSPDDLRQHTLLANTRRPSLWEEYLAAEGCSLPGHQTLSFERFFLVIRAVREALGVALVPLFLVRDELEAGRITVPFDRPLASSFAYYLVYPEARVDDQALQAFVHWLEATAGEEVERERSQSLRATPEIG